MAADSKIEWCDHTFNPWIGCTKVSIAATGGGGCDHCYAEVSTPVRVLRGKGAETWGAGAPRVRTSAANWALPKRWNAQAQAFRVQHGRRQRVFCASLADWLDNAVDVEWLIDLLAIVRLTPDLDWLMLSKRIGIWRSRLEAAAAALRDRLERASEAAVALLRWIERWLAGHPPSNVWIGATIVNQAEADRDMPKLLAVPAHVRFLSMEPLFGPVQLTDISDGHADSTIPREYWEEGFDTDASPPAVGHNALTGERWQRFGEWRQDGPRIDWVIVGGESGPSARPMHPDWVRDLRDQCAEAGVPMLFKQWGEWTPGENVERVRGTVDTAFLEDDGWHVHPLNLATDEGHIDDQPDLYRVGKKEAGRLLDGREWNEVPHGAA